MLKRAFSKLKLEHLVIGKGQFQQERTKPSGTDDMEVCDICRNIFNLVLVTTVLLVG